MRANSLRILVVEDDYHVATKLEREVLAAGDVVVGPFARVDEAIDRVGLVQAAILDVKVRDDTSFALADSLFRHEVPFVFLTGYGKEIIPTRFGKQHIYVKPSHAEPILDDLHRQHRDSYLQHEDSMEATLLAMIHRSCALMPDRASADRLVETVLLRAIAERHDGRLGDNVHNRLLDMLNEEYRLRGKLFLH
jgi:ActR/RegA family two-component response regulator